MSQLTLSEIARNLAEHIKHESEYQTRFEEKLDAILLQTTKTNGRVNAIESWKEKEAHPTIEDYKDKNSQAKGAVKLWTLIWGSLAIGVVAAGSLYINKLYTDIGDNTMNRVQNSNIQVTEISPNTGIFKIKIFEGK